MTPKSIFEEKVVQKLTENPEVAKEIDALFQFVIKGDDGGDWLIDFTASSDWVRPGVEEDADCVIIMTDKDFIDLYTGKLPGPAAFMMGKLKIKGDMALALKLGKVFG